MLEFLKTILGENYSEDIDKKISEKIGKEFVPRTDFNQLNDTKKELEKQIGERDGQLEELKKVDAQSLKAEIEKLQEQNSTTKNEYEQTIQELKFDYALENALANAKAKNPKIAKALIQKDGLVYKDSGSDFVYYAISTCWGFPGAWQDISPLGLSQCVCFRPVLQ